MSPADDAPTSSMPKRCNNNRILKKREADRKCQRNIREKRKARIAALEQQVEQLKGKDTSGQVTILLERLAQKDAKLDVMTKKIKAISDTLLDPLTQAAVVDDDLSVTADQGDNIIYGSTVDCLQTPCLHNAWLAPQPDGECYGGTRTLVRDDDPPSTTDKGALVDICHQDRSPYGIWDIADGTAAKHLPGDPIIPRSNTTCACSVSSRHPRRAFNYWRFANEVLSERFDWPTDVLLAPDPARDDIPVRAVVEGWDVVESRAPLHPAWRILRKIDQTLFASCSSRERLAVLFIMHTLFESHSRPDEVANLPEFYRKSPSKRVYSYAINYFTWPGLRERFVLHQHKYCSNAFWASLMRNLRIRWPYEFRDCYVRNLTSGLYELSSAFRERIHDINSWTVNMDFFTNWPELGLDIPTFNSIPPSIVTHVDGRKMCVSTIRSGAGACSAGPNSYSRGRSQKEGLAPTSPMALSQANTHQLSEVYSPQLALDTSWMPNPSGFLFDILEPIDP